jgi:hypothetical protein
MKKRKKKKGDKVNVSVSVHDGFMDHTSFSLHAHLAHIIIDQKRKKVKKGNID